MGGGACGKRPPRPPAPPTPAETWQATLASVQRAADEGRYADAERELLRFAAGNAGTEQAVESAYWRALLKLDPRNPASTPRDAISLVDTILLAQAPNPRREEAIVLRRTALLLDSLRAEVETPKPPLVIVDTTRDVTRERQYEERIKILEDSLTATLAEVDRIRKRLGAPRP